MGRPAIFADRTLSPNIHVLVEFVAMQLGQLLRTPSALPGLDRQHDLFERLGPPSPSVLGEALATMSRHTAFPRLMTALISVWTAVLSIVGRVAGRIIPS